MFFEQPGCLQAFARMSDRLQDDVAVQAIKIASRLIIAIARRIAGCDDHRGAGTLVDIGYQRRCRD